MLSIESMLSVLVIQFASARTLMMPRGKFWVTNTSTTDLMEWYTYYSIMRSDDVSTWFCIRIRKWLQPPSQLYDAKRALELTPFASTLRRSRLSTVYGMPLIVSLRLSQHTELSLPPAVDVLRLRHSLLETDVVFMELRYHLHKRTQVFFNLTACRSEDLTSQYDTREATIADSATQIV